MTASLPTSGISIVVRTYNSARTLDRVLANMQRRGEDEFVVVDSGSTDATLAIAEKHGAVILQPPGPFHYSKSLNHGFRAAKNPWVLVISSHCVPVVSNFLEIYRREVATFAPDVVVGYAPSTLSGQSDPNLCANQTTCYSKADYPRVAQVCGNGNAIYRRRAWEEMPFDETVRTAEDKLWILEALRRGCRFAYVPMARGLNESRYSLDYMFRKGYRDSRAMRPPGYRPMKLWQLAGALKNMALPKLRGEISWGNWARYSAHIVGQYFGSRQPEDNTPKDGGS
jgi:rhamnosyltransferase